MFFVLACNNCDKTLQKQIQTENFGAKRISSVDGDFKRPFQHLGFFSIFLFHTDRFHDLDKIR